MKTLAQKTVAENDVATHSARDASTGKRSPLRRRLQIAGAIAGIASVAGITAPAQAVEDGTLLWSSQYDAEMELVLSHENGVEGRVEIEGSDSSPSWAPDGAAIVFASPTGQENLGADGREIYKISGDRVQRLTNNNRQDESPDFSPRGDKITYDTRQNDGRLQVMLMDADGANKAALTDIASSWNPSWSHDGRKITFISNRSGWHAIYQMNADGSNQELVYQPLNPIEVKSPSYSPDNGRILFSSHVLGHSEIFWVTIGAGVLQRVTDTADLAESAPVYSPDGRRIAFAGKREGQRPRIYVMDYDGRNVEMVSDPDRYSNWPDWMYPALPVDPPPPPAPAPAPEPAPGPGQGGEMAGEANDVLGPSIQMKGRPKARKTHPAKQVKRFKGITADPNGVEKVELSVKIKSAGKCRHLKPNGKLTKAKSCNRRFKTVASNDGTWVRSVGKLPTGRYRVAVRATDTLSNIAIHQYGFKLR